MSYIHGLGAPPEYQPTMSDPEAVVKEEIIQEEFVIDLSDTHDFAECKSDSIAEQVPAAIREQELVVNHHKRKIEEVEKSASKRPRKEKSALSQLVDSLKLISQKMKERETRNDALTFQTYVDASIQQKALFEKLKAALQDPAFETIPEQEKFAILKPVTGLIGQFPVTDASVEEELALFDLFIQISNGALALDIAEVHIPRLAFNRASLFSMQAGEVITEKTRAVGDADKSKVIDWKEVFGLLQESISRFEGVHAHYKNLENSKGQETCKKAISLGYERLADFHFDAARFLDGALKDETLQQAEKYYEEARNWHAQYSEAISLSVLHVKYELVACKKTDVTEMEALLSYLEQNLSPRKYFRQYPEIAFYMCHALWYLYETGKQEGRKAEAEEALNLFIPYFAKKRQKTEFDQSTESNLREFAKKFSLENVGK